MSQGVVLVVDDNAENRALARATLEDEGYTVELAASGEAGIAAFERAVPDCVLLDIRMPGMDGIAASQRIRALPGGSDVPLLFVTAQRDLDTFDRAHAAGGDDFITKPYRPSELIARVAAAIKLRQLALERGELYELSRQQRDDLLRLQLQKEQLIEFLVHDLKNPVNAIELNAQRITRDGAATERARDAAAKIQSETRTLLRMIMDLLDLGKADEGKLVPERVAIPLGALFDEVAAAMQARAQAARVSLVLAPVALSLDGDPDLLRRVVENLIDNAIRYAPEVSTIRIEAVRTDGGVELRITDAGTGVPLELRERIFDRFTQAGPDTSARTSRGLGLAFCKLAIEAHGGRIWIEDASPGARFCARIPDGGPRGPT
jgi:two-component system, sensor histidine kinase and response regulator